MAKCISKVISTTAIYAQRGMLVMHKHSLLLMVLAFVGEGSGVRLVHPRAVRCVRMPHASTCTAFVPWARTALSAPLDQLIVLKAPMPTPRAWPRVRLVLKVSSVQARAQVLTKSVRRVSSAPQEPETTRNRVLLANMALPLD